MCVLLDNNGGLPGVSVYFRHCKSRPLHVTAGWEDTLHDVRILAQFTGHMFSSFSRHFSHYLPVPFQLGKNCKFLNKKVTISY